WAAHAFFSCLMSFIGLFYLYRAFSSYFRGKEMILLSAICLFPSVWFYTGALLKEALVLLVLGGLAFIIRQVIQRRFSVSIFFILPVLLLVSFLLKPYLLLTASFAFFILFWLQESRLTAKSVYFTLYMLLFFAAINIVILGIRGEGVLITAQKHQRIFAGAANGGIFLRRDTIYLKLPYDRNRLIKTEQKDHYKIRE